MRKNICIVAAAALAVAGMGFNSARADDATNPNQGAAAQNLTPATTQPSGNLVVDADAHAIRDTLAQVTVTSLTHDGFSTLPKFLQRGGRDAASYGVPDIKAGTKGQPADTNTPARQNGTRLENNADKVGPFNNYDDINSAVTQLQKDWKDKYNSDFAINGDNREMVFNDSFRIMQGNIGESARTAGDRVGAADATPPANTDTNAPDDRAMHHATVVVAQGQNVDGVTLHLTNVGQPVESWKIRIHRDQTEQSIHDALLKQLNALHDSRNNWPADQNDAYRAVSAHILSAFSPMDAAATPGNQGQDLPNK